MENDEEKEREKERERDLKLIEVYEHRLSINTNFSSKAGYASRINITIDAEPLGVVKVPGAVFFSLSPPVLRRVHARENVIKRFLSFEIPLSCMPMIRRGEIAAGNYRYSFISLLRISKDFEFLQHHVHILCTIVKTGCENLWKTWRMKMMMYD